MGTHSLVYENQGTPLTVEEKETVAREAYRLRMHADYLVLGHGSIIDMSLWGEGSRVERVILTYDVNGEQRSKTLALERFLQLQELP